MVLGGENVANDGDEELWNGFAVEEEHDRLLERIDLRRHVVCLERLLDLVGQRRRALVEMDNQSAGLLHCSEMKCNSLRPDLISQIPNHSETSQLTKMNNTKKTKRKQICGSE